jgi:hypothetical protein
VVPNELAGVDGRGTRCRNRPKPVYLKSHVVQFVPALFRGYYDS